MQVIAGSSASVLAKEIAKMNDLSIVEPEYKIFSDGETYIRIHELLDKDILIVQTLSHPQEVNLFVLLNLISTCKTLGADRITIFIPYLCYARADRVVLTGEAIGARTVLNLLESTGIDHLITLDVHNPEIFKFTKLKTTNIIPVKSLKKYYFDNAIDLTDYQIIAPDQGAKNRAKAYAEALNLPYDNLQKYRDPITGEVNINMGNVKISKKKILIIDDIMASGRSILESMQLLLMFDIERIDVFVTHLLGSDLIDRMRTIGNGEVLSTTSTNSSIGKISPASDVVIE